MFSQDITAKQDTKDAAYGTQELPSMHWDSIYALNMYIGRLCGVYRLQDRVMTYTAFSLLEEVRRH